MVTPLPAHEHIAATYAFIMKTQLLHNAQGAAILGKYVDLDTMQMRAGIRKKRPISQQCHRKGRKTAAGVLLCHPIADDSAAYRAIADAAQRNLTDDAALFLHGEHKSGS